MWEKWKEIGIHLGLPRSKITDIQKRKYECSTGNKTKECFKEVLEFWVEHGDKDAKALQRSNTLYHLTKAVHAVGECHILTKICEHFGKSSVSVGYNNYYNFFLEGIPLEPCSYIVNQSSTSDIQSEYSDVITKCVNNIKKIYTMQPVLPDSDWPPTLGGEYIRLALIKQGRTMHDFRHKAVVAKQIDYIRGNYDRIMKYKTEISQQELFIPVVCDGDTQIPLRMLIDGAPGVGKTTLTRYISNRWANGEILGEFWLVLLLHLRNSDISKARKIDDFIFHYQQIVDDRIMNFITKTNGRGMLLIFDGFDELSLEERSEKSLFLDIIKGIVLCQCAVVVTSRPHASRAVQELQLVNRHVEILGFTETQVKNCIIKKTASKSKAAKLCEELKDRPDILSICQIPLNCSIVLYVYEMEDYCLPDTLTELYEFFILHTLKRLTKRTRNTRASDKLQDIKELPSVVQGHFNALSKLAFDGLKTDKLVFSKDDMEKCFSSTSEDELPLLDLMSGANSYSARGALKTYNFLHLTIQEYLGAYWVANNLSDKEKLAYVRGHLLDDRFHMSLVFFCGITQLKFKKASSLFTKKTCEKDIIFIFHLLYESQNISICHHVVHTFFSRQIVDISKCTSKFEALMITKVLCVSNSTVSMLKLDLSQVSEFHRGICSLKSSTSNALVEVVQVDVTSDSAGYNLLDINLLDEFDWIGGIEVNIAVYIRGSDFQSRLSDLLYGLKHIIVETQRNKHKVTTISIQIEKYFLSVCRSKIDPAMQLCTMLIQSLPKNKSLCDINLYCFSLASIEFLFTKLTKSDIKLNLTSIKIRDLDMHLGERISKTFKLRFEAFLSRHKHIHVDMQPMLTARKNVKVLQIPEVKLSCQENSVQVCRVSGGQSSNIDSLTQGSDDQCLSGNDGQSPSPSHNHSNNEDSSDHGVPLCDESIKNNVKICNQSNVQRSCQSSESSLDRPLSCSGYRHDFPRASITIETGLCSSSAERNQPCKRNLSQRSNIETQQPIKRATTVDLNCASSTPGNS